jgi:predicted acyl esterase
LLHLRGNVEGFMQAGSKHKYLRLITGRHDLPFYTKECVDLQRSFLDAFLKDVDPEGWSRDVPPRVAYKVRVGDVGYNDAEAESAYPSQLAANWPIPETEYTYFYLTSEGGLSTSIASDKASLVSYKALGNLKNPQVVTFTTPAFDSDTEFTGHINTHLHVSVTPHPELPRSSEPSDIDLFVSVRHLDPKGKEILYTGTVGDPVPVTKGWLRCSLRKVNTADARHRAWRPHRDYTSKHHAPLRPSEIYEVDVEVWPTNVVVQAGEKLVLEISSGDTQGAGLFEHNSEADRNEATFAGVNHIHFGEGRQNWVMLPLVPKTK